MRDHRERRDFPLQRSSPPDRRAGALFGRALIAAVAVLTLALSGCDGESENAVDAEPSAAPSETSADASETTEDSIDESASPSSSPASNDQQSEDGEIVLEDNFDDDANQWVPEGIASGAEATSGEIADGLMTFGVGDEQLLYETWPSVLEDRVDALSDVRVEADVIFTAPGVAAVTCRHSNLTDPNTFPASYQFRVSSAGAYGIVKATPDGEFETLALAPEDLASVPEGEPPPVPAFEFDASALYTVGAECIGGADGSPATLTMFVDGEQVLEAEDPEPLETGIAGLALAATSRLAFEPYGVSFDSFTLTSFGEVEVASDGSEPSGGADGAASFVGSGSCQDQPGDLTDDKGNPINVGGPGPGTDLLSVNLQSDGSALVVTFNVDGSLPTNAAEARANPRGLSWVMNLSFSDREQGEIAGDTAVEDVQAFFDPAVGTYEAAARLDDGSQIPATVEAVSPNMLVVTVPLDQARLPEPSEFTAYTEWNPIESFAAEGTTYVAGRIDDTCDGGTVSS